MAAPLFLIGFMAAGKTSVGRALARETGRRFVDLDDVIAMLGEPVATLLARDEAEFRKREERALASEIAAALDGPVISTGGGAAAHGQNLERMRRAGCVIALAVDTDEARLRAGDGSGRPLLARPAAEVAALAAQRAPVYRRAHAVVDTNGRTIADVTALVRDAEAAWRAAPGDATTVVSLGARSYPVVVGETFDGELIATRLGNVSKLAVITDQTVATHWIEALEAAIDPAVTLEIPPGEAHKTMATYQRLCDALIAQGLDRGSGIVALGGGVVGDIAGFVAATLFRGIPIVQLPTTIVEPGRRLLPRTKSASGSSIRRWIARRSGRAPIAGS